MSSICAECCSQVLDLKSHLKIHKDSKVECEVCGKVLTNRKAFRNHMQTHKSWSCPRCQIVIPHNSRTMHLKKCLKKDLTEFKCDNCPYVTTNKSNLDRHEKAHDKQARFQSEKANGNTKTLGKIHEIFGLAQFQEGWDDTS